MKHRPPLVSLSLLLILLASCATSPKVPQWVLSPPSPDGTSTYFSGSATAADDATAIGDATDRLIAGIMQYIGVDVKVSTSATARASLDSYSADLRQTVQTESSNRMAGFKVTQKYIARDKKTGSVTAHILAAYQTAELEKEKARIAALFKERADAVAKPEAEGDALASEGRAAEAVNKYIEAMAAASGAEVENAGIKLERNANKARAQLASISFLIGDGKSLQGSLGKAFGQALPVRVLRESPAGRQGLPGASLQVSYSRKLPNGQLGSKSQSLITDASGYAFLELPPPDFVGRGRVFVQLDLSSSLELLDKVGPGYQAVVASLEDEIRTKYAELPYIVASGASQVPLAVFVVDKDEQGRSLIPSAFQAGFVDALVKEGFSVRTLSLDPALLQGPQEFLIAQVRAQNPGGAPLRFAYGSAAISAVRKESTIFIAQAGATITIVDLATGSTLYSSDKARQALGNDEANARKNALRELGAQVFAKDILSSLP